MVTPAPSLPFRLPLIAILRGITPAEVPAHVGALVEEGYDAIEIPTNSPDWARSVRSAVDAFGERAMIGAGTVLTNADADALVDAGGRLMVTPNTCQPVIRHAVKRGLQVAAGFATASEAFEALDAGAQILKLFPAALYGPDMVRSLRSVLPPAPIFAVGGVTPEAIASYLSAGCVGAGIGGELYKPGQPVERTREHARRFRQAYLDHTA
ncbi:MAG: 2-dehydro-3-deoxy-6-phosphogalactonate aldolase [Thermomonas sp.]|uniref:2-dehydro-3-deoxy-6-phosphogalactonate aldolase n=1 Tax=Thermomonas sp. TaxID=1971895 RepID=UPI0039E2A61F